MPTVSSGLRGTGQVGADAPGWIASTAEAAPCLTLSTGEDVPKGQSLRARVLVLDVGRGDLDIARLTEAQRDAADGLYAQATAGFIRWLAPQYETIRTTMKAAIAALRDGVDEQCYKRTTGIIADLLFALRLWLQFAVDVGAITEEEFEAHSTAGRAALLEAGALQAAHQAVAEPTRKFLELLGAAITG
jgi:hypothetical protein